MPNARRSGRTWRGWATVDNVSLLPAERIEGAILLIRGHKVMLDADLAALYNVETRVLIQAVKRNIERFPDDFMFQLTKQGLDHLRSQIVTSSWGGRRNIDRFPQDFMVQLTKQELNDLRCQIGISSGWGGRRYPPYAFAEQGVAMLSSLGDFTCLRAGTHRQRGGNPPDDLAA